MLLFKCRRCACEFRTFEKWIDHFWGNTHQVSVRKTFLKWSDQDNLKSLVVYAPSQVAPPLPSEVISMFHKLSLEVEDFVCWTGSPRIFIVQLDSGDEVEPFLQLMRQNAEQLKIGGQPIEARRKSDMLRYEWDHIVGDGTAKEGSSKEPVLIELNDDEQNLPEANAETRQTASKKKKSRDKGRNSNEQNEGPSAATVECSESDEPELAHQNGNGGSILTEDNNTEAEQDDEVEILIKTKMNNKFMDAFHSKMKTKKPEKDADDKSKVKENLRLMQEKWFDDIYLTFFNKLWPTCFGMGNKLKKAQKLPTIGFTATCTCTSLLQRSNRWILMKDQSKEFNDIVTDQVEDFFLLLQNGKKCNKKLKKIDEESERTEKNPLTFTCSILILYKDNPTDTTTELKLSEFKGKGYKKARKLIAAIFPKLFKKYEKIKIKEYAASEKEVPLRSCKSWSQIVTVQLD